MKFDEIKFIFRNKKNFLEEIDLLKTCIYSDKFRYYFNLLESKGYKISNKGIDRIKESDNRVFVSVSSKIFIDESGGNIERRPCSGINAVDKDTKEAVICIYGKLMHDALIDQVRKSDHSLTDEQIKNIYDNSIVETFAHELLHFYFDEDEVNVNAMSRLDFIKKTVESGEVISYEA